MFNNGDELQKFVKEEGVEFIDVRFCDLPGVMQHFNVPVGSFDLDAMTDGLMFDGSSIRGFQAIHESDMKLMPDPATAFIDPFRTAKTLAMNFSIVDPFTDEQYSRDPRNVAAKAEAYLASTGIGDTAYFGPEAEFYVFDDVRFQTNQHEGYYHIDSIEGAWNTGRQEDGGNRGYKTRYKGGYFPVPPVDHFADLRDVMSKTLTGLGLQVERAHHEVGTAGQAEINYKYDTLLHAGDSLMLFKYVVKNVARRYGKIATFMPKPIYGEAGNGMHVHQCLWKDNRPLFFDQNRRNYADLSDLALHYVAGLLAHGQALTALTNPSTNSFKRLVEGYEAPVNLVFSLANRSAAIRVPRYATSPEEKRIEYRPPDATSNIYLMLASMLMAGLDGIARGLDPSKLGFGPFDVDIAKQDAEFKSRIAALPRSLYDAVNALGEDRAFLTKGEVFPDSFIDAWIRGKRREEAEDVAPRPHPREFSLYLDV